MIKILWFGSIQIIAIELVAAQRVLHVEGKSAVSITDVVDQIQSMDEALLESFKKHSVPVVYMEPNRRISFTCQLDGFCANAGMIVF